MTKEKEGKNNEEREGTITLPSGEHQSPPVWRASVKRKEIEHLHHDYRRDFIYTTVHGSFRSSLPCFSGWKRQTDRQKGRSRDTDIRLVIHLYIYREKCKSYIKTFVDCCRTQVEAFHRSPPLIQKHVLSFLFSRGEDIDEDVSMYMPVSHVCTRIDMRRKKHILRLKRFSRDKSEKQQETAPERHPLRQRRDNS